MPFRIGALAALVLAAAVPAARADPPTQVGAVSTTFRIMGRNDRIVVLRYDDPKVDGVSCYMSRAQTGGVRGSLGLATDPSRFSLSCVSTGTPKIIGTLPAQEDVGEAGANWFSKQIRLTRIWDAERHSLVYLVWSTHALTPQGSPYNAVSVVPVGTP